MKLWDFRFERRVNLDYQALREQVGQIKFWGSGLKGQAGRGIRLGRGVSGLRGSGFRRSRWERMRLEGIRLGRMRPGRRVWRRRGWRRLAEAARTPG